VSVYSEQNRNATFHSLEDLSDSKRRIIELLTREPNGLTRHEIGERLRMPLSTVCGRVSELEGDGWLFSTDDTRETQIRKAGDGRPSAIHRKTSSTAISILTGV
jgi:predicted ArsR family transcriptional regulator